ncbi:hypothetical protein CO058_01370 [candidate division WWE3 bacterium CG_4_9_14_0_2_um_filter_35_11]|uniref:Uncharacterized protein n=1 Tax=candidate division WWE3 bacterium CG_4_9_14_0_2_um_filter_35_11 TaxID=1975077 RepID=A0A2M8EM60_UNCKA|nr:MAG: hypothetical protein COV25_04340 [candidate division WWE3 bacterium CG10_big_fil_rev_8_21_14_0_10_35_32]PJC23810.1 MAG: hypothetical protein CO058_01370 [candidate division WWE3 bacterium CG_4_9_14_0_2_um_filter_35_11]
MIGYLKPDDNAFIEAIRILNESPKDLFFIDDKDANVKAAKNFGINGAVASDTIDFIISLAFINFKHFSFKTFCVCHFCIIHKL